MAWPGNLSAACRTPPVSLTVVEPRDALCPSESSVCPGCELKCNAETRRGLTLRSVILSQLTRGRVPAGIVIVGAPPRDPVWSMFTTPALAFTDDTITSANPAKRKRSPGRICVRASAASDSALVASSSTPPTGALNKPGMTWGAGPIAEAITIGSLSAINLPCVKNDDAEDSSSASDPRALSSHQYIGLLAVSVVENVPPNGCRRMISA